MKRKNIVFALAAMAIITLSLCWPRGARQGAKLTDQKITVSSPVQHFRENSGAPRATNALGDILTDSQDPVFLNQVFPKVREFFATLKHLGINPLSDELQSDSCIKIRIIQIPDGIMCRFLIGDGWSARYTQNSVFSGVVYFGQTGPDDPNRAISHANTNALRRLSQNAIHMPEAEAWKIANRVADAFGIDRSKFEKPEMYEEALFEFRLGIQSVQYRKKGSDPFNQMNYTRSFSLKATSPTNAVLVAYSHLEATQK